LAQVVDLVVLDLLVVFIIMDLKEIVLALVLLILQVAVVDLDIFQVILRNIQVAVEVEDLKVVEDLEILHRILLHKETLAAAANLMAVVVAVVPEELEPVLQQQFPQVELLAKEGSAEA
jgi:hypothetical protein